IAQEKQLAFLLALHLEVSFDVAVLFDSVLQQVFHRPNRLSKQLFGQQTLVEVSLMVESLREEQTQKPDLHIDQLVLVVSLQVSPELDASRFISLQRLKRKTRSSVFVGTKIDHR